MRSRAVIDYLRSPPPDPEVLEPPHRLALAARAAAVSASADARIAARFEVTGLAGFFPPQRRFSAEDSLLAASSAVAAGFAPVGNLQFVPPDERKEREEALREIGVVAVVKSWAQVEALLSSARPHPALPARSRAPASGACACPPRTV